MYFFFIKSNQIKLSQYYLLKVYCILHLIDKNNIKEMLETPAICHFFPLQISL